MKTHAICPTHFLMRPMRRFALPFAVAVLAAAACGDGDDSQAQAELTFASETQLFPNFEFSTGLQPAGSPVQASFTVSAKGVGKVSAAAAASEESSPTLTGLPGRGALAIDGGFALVGQLKVDVDGLPSYDGPIPGIDNVQIAFAGSAAFDPFAIDHPVSARADIPAARLPGIPLPGGLPGELVLEVAEGSFVEIVFAGVCAGIDGSEATYSGTIDRGGSLVIRPLIEIEVPVLGTKTFEIPSFTIDLALGSSDVDMAADVKEFGDAPPDGDPVSGSCTDDGAGGATSSSSASGQGGSTTTTGPTSCDTGQPGNWETSDDVCTDCIQCTKQSTCATEWAPCEIGTQEPCDLFVSCLVQCDAECGADDDCWVNCVGNPYQPGTCVADNPAGDIQLHTFLVCSVCEACPINCNAEVSCAR